MTEQEYDEIVAGFYRAATGTDEWADVLNHAAGVLSAWAIPLMGVDKRNGTMLFSHHGGPASPAAALDYMRGYYAIDPRAQLLMRSPYGTWVHCHEHFDDAFVATDPFYQQFLLPHGGRFVSGTKVSEDDETVVVLGIHRAPEHGPFSQSECPWLMRLADQLRGAIGIYRSLRQAFEEAGAGRELLDKFAYPMLLVDELGGIRFRNRAAKDALSEGDYAVDRGGILACRDRQSHADLMAALQDLGLQGASRAVPDVASRRFVRLRRLSSGTPIIANLVAIRPHSTMAAFGKSQVALVLFHDPTIQRDLDPFLVAEMFGLTPAEARVAVMLRRGLSPQAIAEESRLSLATVRSQVQAIFAKTGVNRQPDLVRLLEGLAGIETLSQ